MENAEQLSPGAMTVYRLLCERWNGHPQAGRFIRAVKQSFDAAGYFITGDEFGEIIAELHKSGLVRFQVRRDAIGLVPVRRFQNLRLT
ncbi:MAG: hypothetical protein KIT79_15290 [Deltaproteobacteria bacterium]|nr:hypothetical protein [Deltaproteobacteria bacterium]